jgi:hypothetical protein
MHNDAKDLKLSGQGLGFIALSNIDLNKSG